MITFITTEVFVAPAVTYHPLSESRALACTDFSRIALGPTQGTGYGLSRCGAVNQLTEPEARGGHAARPTFG